MKKNPEKLMLKAWNELLKSNGSSGGMIPASVFRWGYVSGWNDFQKTQKCLKIRK